MIARKPTERNGHRQKVRDQKSIASLTCEVLQTELTQAKVPIPPVIEEDCEGVAVLIQLGSTDDPQVLQRQVVKLV